jgi:hypothetical protein
VSPHKRESYLYPLCLWTEAKGASANQVPKVKKSGKDYPSTGRDFPDKVVALPDSHQEAEA